MFRTKLIKYYIFRFVFVFLRSFFVAAAAAAHHHNAVGLHHPNSRHHDLENNLHKEFTPSSPMNLQAHFNPREGPPHPPSPLQFPGMSSALTLTPPHHSEFYCTRFLFTFRSILLTSFSSSLSAIHCKSKAAYCWGGAGVIRSCIGIEKEKKNNFRSQEN